MKAKKFVRQIRDLFLQYPITFPNVESWSNNELFLATELALKTHVGKKQAPALAATLAKSFEEAHNIALKDILLPKGYKLSEVQKRDPEVATHLLTLTRRGHAIGDILAEADGSMWQYHCLHFMSDETDGSIDLQVTVDCLVSLHNSYLAEKKKGGK